MRERNVVLVAGGLALALTYSLPRACGSYRTDSGVSLKADVADPSSIRGAAADAPSSGTLIPEDGGVDARLSGQVAQSGGNAGDLDGGSRQSAQDVGSAGSSPALASFQLADYEDSFLDTEEGLIDMTLGVWENEEFLSLTQDEAHELLGLDDTIGLRGPGSLLDMIGPLPTVNDCRIAFRSSFVKAALRDVVSYEVVIERLGSIPAGRREVDHQGTLRGVIRLRDSAALVLMRELDEASTYGNWELWHKLYRRWAHGS